MSTLQPPLVAPLLQSLMGSPAAGWPASKTSKQADTVSEGVDVTRLTEAVNLSVVCVGVRGQPVTFDHLQQVGDVQQKVGPSTDR